MQTRKNKRNGIFSLFHSCSHEKPYRELNRIHYDLLPRAFLRKKKGPFAEGIPLELLVRLSRLMSGQRK